jgi:3-dehydroquinate synthase
VAQAHLSAVIEDRVRVEVVVGAGAVEEAGERLAGYDGAFLVLDSGLPSGLAGRVKAAVSRGTRLLGVSLGGGESAKSLSWVAGLWEAMASAGVTRGSVLVAAGGGALLDAAGFAAATYMRGIDTVYVPTTSLAMLDAAVGGKTGVNVAGAKNIVGAFHHPALVAADVGVLAGLPERQFRQGLAEAVKHAALESRLALERISRSSDDIMARDLEALSRLVEWSLSFKLSVVSRDYRERGLRRILNLGHTVAHAIEAASGFTVPHGEAVSMGLALEAELSVELAGLQPWEAGEIRDVLASLGLPVEASPGLLKAAASKLRMDKKRRGGAIAMPLLEAIGRPVIIEVDLAFLESWLRRAAGEG